MSDRPAHSDVDLTPNVFCLPSPPAITQEIILANQSLSEEVKNLYFYNLETLQYALRRLRGPDEDIEQRLRTLSINFYRAAGILDPARSPDSDQTIEGDPEEVRQQPVQHVAPTAPMVNPQQDIQHTPPQAVMLDHQQSTQLETPSTSQLNQALPIFQEDLFWSIEPEVDRSDSGQGNRRRLDESSPIVADDESIAIEDFGEEVEEFLRWFSEQEGIDVDEIEKSADMEKYEEATVASAADD